MSADSPTPAAPAGSGWPNCGPSSLSLDDVLRAMRRLADEDSHTGHPGAVGATLIEAGCWIRQALARAEAAERERDTISCNAIPTWPACEDGLDRRQHNDPVCWGCYSAEKAIRREVESQLAASTEREAGLRKLCEEALEEVYSAFAAAVILASPPSIVNPAFRAEELWAFAKARNSRDALRARLASLAAPEGGTDG